MTTRSRLAVLPGLVATVSALTFMVVTFLALAFMALTFMHSSARASDAPRYADVLAAPDDLALNLAYAQRQIRDRDFEGASVTLERLLLTRPGLDRVRLLRAAVLLRLDDHAGARRELDLLASRPLSDEEQAEAATLRAALVARADGTELTATARAGLVFDSNPVFTPSGDTVIIGGSIVPRSRVREADAALVAGGHLALRHAFGGANGHAFLASAEGSWRRQRRESISDRSHLHARAGVFLDFGSMDLTAEALARLQMLRNESFSRELGGQLLLRAPLSRAITAFASAEAVHEDYDSIAGLSPDGNDRDGARIIGRIGLAFAPFSPFSGRLAATLARKEARRDYHAYQAAGLEGLLRYQLGSGQTIDLNIGVSRVNFDAPKPFYSAFQVRHDTRLSLRLAYAVSVATLLDEIGVASSGFEATSIELYTGAERWRSSLRTFSTDNLTAGMTVSRRFSW